VLPLWTTPWEVAIGIGIGITLTGLTTKRKQKPKLYQRAIDPLQYGRQKLIVFVLPERDVCYK
jgi:hypothetical protein